MCCERGFKQFCFIGASAKNMGNVRKFYSGIGRRKIYEVSLVLMVGGGLNLSRFLKESHLFKNTPLDHTLGHPLDTLILAIFYCAKKIFPKNFIYKWDKIDLFEQETNSKRNIKCQGYKQCSTLEGQKDYYGDIIQKILRVKKNKFRGGGCKNI